MKKLRIKLLVILLFGVLLTSCKKDLPYDDDYEVSGYVLDELTGKPIAYATVGVLQISREDFLGWGAKTVASGTADSTGYFKYHFHANENDNLYELVARKDDHYFEKSNFPDISFNKNGKTTQNVTLMPHGYLTLVIKGNKGGWTIGGIGQYRFYRGVDTSVTLYETPNQNSAVNYVVRNEQDSIIYTSLNTILIPLPPRHGLLSNRVLI
ncbi:MAG: carboxypeptidase-like regulatory domain-containing protein [Bacteroidetes bacterium]|nr:carboxypeptidase-like regulatory domain-containing protein [Bacteroidota bacterium]